jgi:hypothetical protein
MTKYQSRSTVESCSLFLSFVLTVSLLVTATHGSLNITNGTTPSQQPSTLNIFKKLQGVPSGGPTASRSPSPSQRLGSTPPSSVPTPEPHSPSFVIGGSDKENVEEVESILNKLKSDVLDFRDEMERVYGARCKTSTLTKCSKNNFNDCSSTFPSQYCIEADELTVDACGDGENCNGTCAHSSLSETFRPQRSLKISFLSSVGQNGFRRKHISRTCTGTKR